MKAVALLRRRLLWLLLMAFATGAGGCFVSDPLLDPISYALVGKSSANVLTPRPDEAIVFIWVASALEFRDPVVTIGRVQIPNPWIEQLLRVHVEPGELALSFSYVGFGHKTSRDSIAINLAPGEKVHLAITDHFLTLDQTRSNRLERIEVKTRVFTLCANNTRLCAEGEAMTPPAAAPPAPAKP